MALAATAAAARRGVRYALNHLTERQAIVKRGELVTYGVEPRHGLGRRPGHRQRAAAALPVRLCSSLKPRPSAAPMTPRPHPPGPARSGRGTSRRSGLDRAAARARVDKAVKLGALVRAEVRYTTQTALQRERQILKMEREGRGVVTPLLPDASQAILNGELTAGQRDAVFAVATTTNRVIGVQGLAGTGKSHMLREAKALVSSTGHEDDRGRALLEPRPSAAGARNGGPYRGVLPRSPRRSTSTREASSWSTRRGRFPRARWSKCSGWRRSTAHASSFSATRTRPRPSRPDDPSTSFRSEACKRSR